MTCKVDVLTNLRSYKGTNGVIIGDGLSLQINGIGDTNIKQMIIMLPLKNILFVLELTRNILSFNQLTTQHPVHCEFSDENSCVNDRTTGQKLMTGARRGDLYQNTIF